MGGVRRVDGAARRLLRRGLKILRLRRLGCARRFYLAVDAVETTGRAPTPAELAARDRVVGAPDGFRAAGASVMLRRVRDRPALLAELLREARGRYVCLPGRVVGLLAGATPRDERAALLHARRGVRPTRLPSTPSTTRSGRPGSTSTRGCFPREGRCLRLRRAEVDEAAGLVLRCVVVHGARRCLPWAERFSYRW